MQFYSVPLQGRLDANRAGTSQSQIEKDLNALPTPPSHVILGLADVTYLSSAGLRLFLVLHRRCAAQGGSLVLAGVHSPVQDVLEIAGLENEFPRYASDAEARAALEK